MRSYLATARSSNRIWTRYGIALLLSLVALPLTVFTYSLTGYPTFMVYVAAVVVSVWFGGFGPGLLATALGTLLVNYYVLAPQNRFDFGVDNLILMGIFVLVSTLVGSLHAARQRAEQQAQVQAEQLRVTLASIGDGVIATDQAGRVTFMNPVAEALTGWQQADATGKPLEAVFSIINEQSRTPVENPVALVIREGKVVGLANHTVLITRDGSELPIDDSGAPIRDARGAITGAVLIFRDVSQRRREESHQLFLSQATSALVTSLDYTTTLKTLANLALPQLADLCTIHTVTHNGNIQQQAVAHREPEIVALVWELERRNPIQPDQLYGLPMVLHTGQPEIVPAVSAERIAAFATDPEQLAMLLKLQVRSSICMPLIARGHTLGAITLMRTGEATEASAQLAAEIALAEELARRAALAVDNARLYQEAQEALKARDTFMTIAAHELRTPITSLLGYAQILLRRSQQENTTSQRDRRALEIMSEQAVRLSTLINEMLDLARLQLGQFNIVQAPMDLDQLARRIVADLQPTIEQHTVTVVSPPQPAPISGDQLRLEQVLQNLLENAIKYSPQGGAVTVNLEQRDGQVYLSVADQGFGIAKADQAQLFQRFYRSNKAHAQHINGLGIGLYVASQIVLLHRGTVSVVSEEGQGSTFTIMLPLS